MRKVPVGLHQVPPQTRFAYPVYIKERKALLADAQHHLRDKDKFETVVRKVRALDQSIVTPPMVLQEDTIVARPIGRPFAAAKACVEAAETRKSKHAFQSYNNCGLESWRIFINHQRRQSGEAAVSEDEVLSLAITRRWAADSDQPELRGGSGADGQVALLAHFGVTASVMEQSSALVVKTVLQGIPISVGIDPSKVWPSRYGSGVHAVVVTGVEFDEVGEVVGYTVNDTGQGECGLHVSKARLDAAMIPHGHAVVVQDRTW